MLFNGSSIDPGSVNPATQNAGHRRRVRPAQPRLRGLVRSSPTANVDKPGPIALDGRVITTPIHPRRRSAAGRRSSRSGRASQANEVERTNLYNTLRFGALPVALSEQGVETRRADPRRRLPGPGAHRRRDRPEPGAPLHDRLLPPPRRPGRGSADLLHARQLRGLPPDRRHADAGRGRRLHPLDRHGGGRQHPHLRADEGGDPGSARPSARQSRQGSTGRGRASSTRTSARSWSPRGSTGRGRPWCAASRWC